MRVVVLLGVVLGCREAPQRSEVDVHRGFPDVRPSLLVTNPHALMAIETSGWSFGDVLGTRDPAAPRRRDYAEESADVMMRSPVYRDLIAALRHDLEAIQEASPDVGVSLDHAKRVFDAAWLASERSHYELVGVVNRFDLRTATVPGCGQTRLIYRLAHRPASADRPTSRLPMTVSLIYFDRRTDCRAVAQEWLALEGATGDELVARLRAGPLVHLRANAFDRIELNVQSTRLSPRLESRAEYVLRGFDVVAGRLVVSGLRNTPRTDLRGADLAALRGWIREHIAAIDAGTGELPEAFLATTAMSVTPYGLGRRANRPFKVLFSDATAAFGDLDLTGNHLVATPELLVRRLDEMTCVGCHQARSIAGFHVLGEERASDARDELTVGISSHLREVLEWRYRFLHAAAAGQELAEVIPFPEHGDDAGRYGAHCTLPGDLARILAWHCADGLDCVPNPVEGDAIGVCVPAGAARPGDPCRSVKLVAHDAPDDDIAPVDSRPRCTLDPTSRARAGGRCDVRGFPAGHCTARCSDKGSQIGDAVCAVLPHFGFELACFRPGVKPEECLEQPGNFVIELLRRCSRTDPCRDDYVCMRMPYLPPDQGACAPPYFLTQARIDQAPIDR